MDQRVKGLWVSALRSGEYQQGRGNLRRDDKFCCLGVLCDLAVKEGVIPEPAVGPDRKFSYSGDMAILPERVSGWAGLEDCHPEVSWAAPGDYKPVWGYGLAEVNDHISNVGTFPVIADLIEEQL